VGFNPDLKQGLELNHLFFSGSIVDRDLMDFLGLVHLDDSSNGAPVRGQHVLLDRPFSGKERLHNG
jgi:hypothetical protein